MTFDIFRRNFLREQKKDNELKKKKDLEAKKKKRTSMVCGAVTVALTLNPCFWFRSDRQPWRLPRLEQMMTTWEWLAQKLMMRRPSSSEM